MSAIIGECGCYLNCGLFIIRVQHEFALVSLLIHNLENRPRLSDAGIAVDRERHFSRFPRPIEIRLRPRRPFRVVLGRNENLRLTECRRPPTVMPAELLHRHSQVSSHNRGISIRPCRDVRGKKNDRGRSAGVHLCHKLVELLLQRLFCSRVGILANAQSVRIALDDQVPRVLLARSENLFANIGLGNVSKPAAFELPYRWASEMAFWVVALIDLCVDTTVGKVNS